MTYTLQALTKEQKFHFETEGFLLVQGLYNQEHIDEIKDTFGQIANQVIPGHFNPKLDEKVDDPLLRYPRVMHPHRFNETARRYMLHDPVLKVLNDLYHEEPLAAQSMYYYKPPGSRGQALHQDNFYLRVSPGNCIAAWTAIDAAEEENGCLMIVPKTQQYDIVCPDSADENESFTNHYVKPPKDRKVMPVVMEEGDTLFFNGNLIHGSYKNKSADRFRRAFICHYANRSAESIGMHYRPLYNASGQETQLQINNDGGPCGIEFESVYPH